MMLKKRILELLRHNEFYLLGMVVFFILFSFEFHSCSSFGAAYRHFLYFYLVFSILAALLFMIGIFSDNGDEE